MQQVMGEQKVPKADWYVQVDSSSGEVQVNRSLGLKTYGQDSEFNTTNGQGGGKRTNQ